MFSAFRLMMSRRLLPRLRTVYPTLSSISSQLICNFIILVILLQSEIFKIHILYTLASGSSIKFTWQIMKTQPFRQRCRHRWSHIATLNIALCIYVYGRVSPQAISNANILWTNANIINKTEYQDKDVRHVCWCGDKIWIYLRFDKTPETSIGGYIFRVEW